MDTAAPERITVRVRGGIESGTVVWRRDGKIRVTLRTGKTRTFDASAEWRPVAPNLTEGQRREMFPRLYARFDAECAARESAIADERPTPEMLDFSVEAMGYCHGIHAPRYHYSRRWP